MLVPLWYDDGGEPGHVGEVLHLQPAESPKNLHTCLPPSGMMMVVNQAMLEKFSTCSLLVSLTGLPVRFTNSTNLPSSPNSLQRYIFSVSSSLSDSSTILRVGMN